MKTKTYKHFLPKMIRVGFNKQLSYITAIEFTKTGKKKCRSDKSFNSWIDKDIPIKEQNNDPQSGFKLITSSGGTSYGWNKRKDYALVKSKEGYVLL